MLRALVRSFAVLAALVLMWTSVQAVPASAAPPPVAVTLAGDSSVFGSVITFTYTLTVPVGGVDEATVTTEQDPALPASAGSVRDALVDGVAAVPGSVTLAGANLTFALGTLSAGPHTVTFPVGAPGTSATYSSRAGVSYSVAGVPQTVVESDPVVVTVNPPLPAVDLAIALPQGSGEDQTLGLGTGQQGDFEVYVSNSGTGASDATLVVDLPPGLTLGPDGVLGGEFEDTPLPCARDRSHPGRVRCAVGSIAPGEDNGSYLDVELVATAAGTPGATVTFGVTVEPAPDPSVEADPSDNTVTGSIRFTGVADLQYSISKPSVTVTVGHSTVLTLRVTNKGPQAVDDTIGFLQLQPPAAHFDIVAFSGATLPTQQIDRAGFPGGPVRAGRAGTGRADPGGHGALVGPRERHHVAGTGLERRRPGRRPDADRDDRRARHVRGDHATRVHRPGRRGRPGLHRLGVPDRPLGADRRRAGQAPGTCPPRVAGDRRRLRLARSRRRGSGARRRGPARARPAAQARLAGSHAAVRAVT